jgi:hypothetical protein
MKRVNKLFTNSEIMIDGINVIELHGRAGVSSPRLDISSGKFRIMFLPVIRAGQHFMLGILFIPCLLVINVKRGDFSHDRPSYRNGAKFSRIDSKVTR